MITQKCRMAIVAFVSITLLLYASPAQCASISCVEIKKQMSADDINTMASDAMPAMKRHFDFSQAATHIATLFTAHNAYCVGAILVGEIRAGDAELIKEFLDKEPLVSSIHLMSPGGNVKDAIEIGHEVRARLIETVADSTIIATGNSTFRTGKIIQKCTGKQCICASSCFIIWAGGIQRQGDYIGLHRPSLSDQFLGPLQPKEAQEQYAKLINDTGEYLKEMEIPRTLIDIMLATPKEQIYIFGEKHDREPGPDELNGIGTPASIKDWIDASCNRLSGEELKIVINDLLSATKVVSDSYKKYTAFVACQALLILTNKPGVS